MAGEVSTAAVERAFRLAIAGDVFTASGMEIETQAARYFSLCGGQRVHRRRWTGWWREIIAAGGVDSWLYKIVDPEAAATLAHLRELGCRLVAASNSNGTLAAELRSFGLLEHFCEVHDSTLIGAAKPSLTFFEHVLRSCCSGSVFHVGDDLIKDVVAAAPASFRCAILYDPSGIYGGIPPHVRIRRLSELPAVIGAV